jgi:hypothetical protein
MSATDERVEIDEDIQRFSDATLTGATALAIIMLRDPGLDQERRETLTRRLGMFLAEKAIRDDTPSNIGDWQRIIRESQADGVNPFA